MPLARQLGFKWHQFNSNIELRQLTDQDYS